MLKYWWQCSHCSKMLFKENIPDINGCVSNNAHNWEKKLKIFNISNISFINLLPFSKVRKKIMPKKFKVKIKKIDADFFNAIVLIASYFGNVILNFCI